MNLTKLFKTIYQIAKKEKTDIYAVGGYVRDRILDIKDIGDITDIDFVVLGSGLEFARKFAEQFSEDEGSLIEFPDFDTARFIFQDGSPKSEVRSPIEIEFAGARSEAYRAESRKPKVEPATLEQDLSRRDFTINAMAQKVMAAGLAKKIIDPFGGQKDLKQKILRTPLDPNETFSEDPLRMLRAARFAAQRNFTIEEKTYTAMHDNRKRLKIVSAERIQEEFLKLLTTSKPSIGLWILYQTHVLDEFLPEISALSGVEEIYGQQHKDNLVHTFRVVDNIAEHSDNVLLRFAGLMHDIGKPETKKLVRGRGWTFDMHEHVGKKMAHIICRRLRVSRDATQYIAKLVRWHMQPINLMDEGVTDSAVRRLIVTLKDHLSDLLILCRSDITTGNPSKLQRRMKNYDYLEKRIAEVIEIDKLRAFQSPVRGEEIMDICGLKPGPTVGKIKKALEEAILDGKVPNEYEEVKKYFEEIKGEYVGKAEAWERL